MKKEFEPLINFLWDQVEAHRYNGAEEFRKMARYALKLQSKAFEQSEILEQVTHLVSQMVKSPHSVSYTISRSGKSEYTSVILMEILKELEK